MESIAIISDIHSNLEALKTVLKDIEKRGIKRIFCLGDIIAKGSHPHECIKIIKEKCEVIVQGNCDEAFSRDYDFSTLSERGKKVISWNQNMITKEDQLFLSKLPFCYEFYMSGSLVRIFHASPDSLDTRMSSIDPLEKKFSLFKPTNKTVSDKMADIIIYGHLHTQLLEHIYNRTLANAGSVGNPLNVIRNKEKDGHNMEITRASYLIITGEYDSLEYTNNLSIEFVKVPYDMHKELATSSNNIEKDAYEKELTEGTYRNHSKLKEYLEKLGIDIDDM